MTARRCAACRRRLRQPSPDGYGPVCRRRLTPAGGIRTTGSPRATGPRQLALIPEPAPTEDEPEPPTYWEHTGRPKDWRPVTVTVRYGPGRGEPEPPFPLAVTGRTAPRNVAIHRDDGTTDVVPVRTLRRKDPR